MSQQATEKKPLKWRYFDGGGNEQVLTLARLSYRLFPNDGPDSDFRLYQAHMGQEIRYEFLGTVSSQQEADAAVREHAAPQLKKVREDLEAAEAALS